MRTTATFLFKTIGIVLFAISTASAASAQTPGPAPAGPAAGGSISGSLASLATAEAARQTFHQNDSLLNGALIGAGVGVATELFVCTRMEPWRICRNDVGSMLKFGAIGAGIGIAIDALFRDRPFPGGNDASATRVHAAPIASRQRKGVQLSVRF